MTPLHQFLIDSGGVVTFEAFMRWALYDPDHGYYSRGIANVGRTGDFSTSATLSPALAQAIAAWALEQRAAVLQPGGRWHIIEVGPGNGQLSAGILRAISKWTRSKLTYHLIEVSAPLAERQRETLHGLGRGFLSPNLRWHGEITSALEEASGQALIFSNELVDAFPCVVLTRNAAGDDWREVGLRWDDARKSVVEVLLDPCAKRAAEYGAVTAALPDSARRIEIQFSWRDWLATWRPAWKVGRMLTIDYGDPSNSVYHRRPNGTLRGYFRQQRIEGAEIYARAGHQDLTADVNFSDLIRWGHASGLNSEPLQTQRGFVLSWNQAAETMDAATAQILDPLGAGRAFKVLEQSAS